jgi:hypothetical protein
VHLVRAAEEDRALDDAGDPVVAAWSALLTDRPLGVYLTIKGAVRLL